MVRRLPLVALLTALIASNATAGEYPASRRKVVSILMLDLTPVGAPVEVAQNLSAVIAAELVRYDGLKSVTRRELSSLLDLERQKQLAGCSEDGCVSQIAGAIGVDKLLTGQLGRVENAYVVTLQLLDARTGKVDARISRAVAADANQLVDTTKATITDLIGLQASSKNQPPRVAVARAVTAHRGERVSLDASRCYDPDGDPLRIRWRQVEGPPALLESTDRAAASFEAAEVGEYTFAVSVSDGRSNIDDSVKVEVLERRRFMIALGYQQLLAFNRIVEKDAAGNVFRNRAPLGGALIGAVKLNDDWVFTGEFAGSFMHTYPEDASLEPVEALDVWELSLMIGLRRVFRFDGFNLYAAGSVGTSRLLITAKQNTTVDNYVRAETLMGDLSVGVEIPVAERFGLIGNLGLRGRRGTDSILPFPGIDFQVADDGFLWGVNGNVSVYVRL